MPRNFMRTLAPAATALAVAWSVPASATETTFATFTGLGKTFIATNPGTLAGSLSLSDTSTVMFNFVATNLTPAISGISANFVFTASSSNANYNTLAATSLGIAEQPLFSGSLSFTSTQAFTVGSTTYAVGSNLLTATFDNATLQGTLGRKNAGVTADSDDGTLTYTSDLLTFTDTVSRDYSIALGAIVPKLTSGTDMGVPDYLEGFTSTPTGSFSSDPAPTGTADVPEPATWAMMLVGLGAIGLSLRGYARRNLHTA